MSRNIVLIGFMGAQKTSLGYRLAKNANMGFLDTQAYIEDRQNRLISLISAQSGLHNTLALERQVVEIITHYDDLVVSLGMKTVTDEYSMHKIRSSGYIIWLDCGLDCVLERASGREPLNSMNQYEFERYYHRHVPVFEHYADMTFDTSGDVDQASLNEMAHRLHCQIYYESQKWHHSQTAMRQISQQIGQSLMSV